VRLIETLKKLRITESSHIAMILESSREEPEIVRLIETLKKLRITEGYHIAKILQSSRKEPEIERLIKTLKKLRITEGIHIAMILSSSREEPEIERLIKTLKKLRITEGAYIAMILSSSREEPKIKPLIRTLKRLGIEEGYHIALIVSSFHEEIDSLIKTLKALGIEENAHIALILHRSRKKTEIEGLIELKRIISQEKNGSYPEYFVKDMLLRFAFMDDPLPVLRKIMNIDFDKVRLEIEQMPVNTTREQFEQEYDDMSIWILRFFRKNFRSLRTVIRGYAKKLLFLDIIPEAERVIAASGSLEDDIDNVFLKNSLAEAIVRLSDAEQNAVAKYLEGYSEEEILSIYPGVSMPEVFAKLREIIINDQRLLDSISPYYGPADNFNKRGKPDTPGFLNKRGPLSISI
jgi:transcriptional regulator with XRE-family HTH domain